MLLHSKMISLHLDLYTAFPKSTSVLDWRYFWQSRIQSASTIRLLAGVEAGDPAERKHLMNRVHARIYNVQARPREKTGCTLRRLSCFPGVHTLLAVPSVTTSRKQLVVVVQERRTSGVPLHPLSNCTSALRRSNNILQHG